MNLDDPDIEQCLSDIVKGANKQTMRATLDEVSKRIIQTKIDLALLTATESLLINKLFNFDKPHWTPSTEVARCVDCGKNTRNLWNYMPRCKPVCRDEKGNIPLDAETEKILQEFLDETN